MPAPMTYKQKLERMIAGYIVCALWSSVDENEQPLDHGRDERDLSPECRAAMGVDCDSFLKGYTTLLEQYAVAYQPKDGFDVWECAGHDFWLTRNGHGAGFWDRGLGKLGDDLSAAAKTFSGVDLYVNDHGKVCCL